MPQPEILPPHLSTTFCLSSQKQGRKVLHRHAVGDGLHIDHVGFSSEGNRLIYRQWTLVRGSGKWIELDVATGKERQLPGESYQVSPDGTRMVELRGRDQRVFETATGRLVRRTEQTEANVEIRHETFMPDGRSRCRRLRNHTNRSEWETRDTKSTPSEFVTLPAVRNTDVWRDYHGRLLFSLFRPTANSWRRWRQGRNCWSGIVIPAEWCTVRAANSMQTSRWL